MTAASRPLALGRGRRGNPAGVLVLLVAMVVTLLPLVSMALTALQPEGSSPSGLSVPAHPQWQNFVTAWNVATMGALLRSSVVIAAVTVPLTLLVASMAGYALAHLPFRGAGLVYGAFLVGLTLPYEALIAPLYVLIGDLGFLNTRWAIIVPLSALFMPFSVFWMRAHFLSLPRDLLDAPRIDGANTWQAFRHVYLPLTTPAWSSLAILLFLWTWNQFLLAVTLVDEPTRRTMAGALGAFQGQYGTDIVLLCAGSLLIIAPTIVVFLVFQRGLVAAILRGAER